MNTFTQNSSSETHDFAIIKLGHVQTLLFRFATKTPKSEFGKIWKASLPQHSEKSNAFATFGLLCLFFDGKRSETHTHVC